jgi:thioredoxin 1
VPYFHDVCFKGFTHSNSNHFSYLSIVIAPKFEEFSDKYPDAVFLKVSSILPSITFVSKRTPCANAGRFILNSLQVIGDATTTASELMKREGVKSVPSFHYFKGGEKVDVVNGANPDAIEASITKHA